MPCSDCPEDMRMPEGLDPDDAEFGRFFKEEFVEMMTPLVLEYNVTLHVAVPLETGQSVLDGARSVGVEHASSEAQEYIDDLATVESFFQDEINAAIRVLELDGYEVKLSIRKSDSPRPSE